MADSSKGLIIEDCWWTVKKGQVIDDGEQIAGKGPSLRLYGR